MLRYLTAGESHGQALVAMLEGIPAHVAVTTADLSDALARRRLGAGRGARMRFEADEVTLLAGVRHGLTLGSPIAVQIGNTEWPRWELAMAADPVPGDVHPAGARHEKLTQPRPGHADLAGMQKYDWDEARPVLERASARETAARVVLGRIAANFLQQAFGIDIVSHVVEIGAAQNITGIQPTPADRDRIDADPVRCLDPEASQRMQDEIAAAHSAGDTLGGVVEVVASGVCPGLGSYSQWDRRLDARLAGALMGIQAIKGVEVGAGFHLARTRGSAAHDEIVDEAGRIQRLSNRAGGIEGGISNGETVWVRAAMKPIATIPRALRTIDTATGLPAKAHHQRSDICAVPAAGVIAEAMVALVLAETALEKFGGDSLAETQRNYRGYLDRLAERNLL